MATYNPEEIAKQVWAGQWGNGTARWNALDSAGYDSSLIQNIVDQQAAGTYVSGTNTSATTGGTSTVGTASTLAQTYSPTTTAPYSTSDVDTQTKLATNYKYIGQYDDAITDKYNSASSNTYTAPYAQQSAETAEKIGNWSAEVSPYAEQLQNIQNQISGYGTYTGTYADAISNNADNILNYGTYESPYAQQIQEYLNNYMNGTYDPSTDALFNSYKDYYTQLGRKAMMDTMGNAASLTGGYGNSYATTAGQQQYDMYMSELAGKIPELAQAAQQMYGNKLNTLLGLDESNYGRWADALNNLYNQGTYLQNLDNAEYGKWTDTLNNLYNQEAMYEGLDDTYYNRQRNELADLYNLENLYETLNATDRAQWESDRANDWTAYQALLNQDQTDYDRGLDQVALQQYKLEQMLNQNDIADANYWNAAQLAEEQRQFDAEYALEQAAAAASGSSSGGSSGSSYSGSSSGSSGTTYTTSSGTTSTQTASNDSGVSAYDMVRMNANEYSDRGYPATKIWAYLKEQYEKGNITATQYNLLVKSYKDIDAD